MEKYSICLLAPERFFRAFPSDSESPQIPKDFIPSAPQGQRKKTRESEGTAVLSDSGSPQIPKESEGTAVPPIPKESEGKARCFSLCPAGAEEKNTGFPHVFFTEPFMAREKNLSHTWLGGNAPLASKIASDFRRQRSGPPKIHRIFGGQRKKDRRSFFPRIGKMFFPLPRRGRGKKHAEDKKSRIWGPL